MKEKISKAAFVRRYAATAPPEQIIAEGKAAGLIVTPNDVYQARAYARKNGRELPDDSEASSPPVRTKPPARTNGAARYRRDDPLDLEREELPTEAIATHDLLRKLGGEIGYSRAIEILQKELDDLRGMLGATGPSTDRKKKR